VTVGVDVPAPELAVLGVAPLVHAATPTVAFTLGVTDASRLEVYTIALSAQVQLDPPRRAYDPETRERLADLFGDPARWAHTTTQSLQWGRVDLLVPSFTGTGTAELQLPCSPDLERAVARYVSALDGGTIPLTFHFSGSVLYRGEADRLQVVQVPWSCSAKHRLPLATLRQVLPDGGYVHVGADTLELLRRRRTEHGLPTFDACIAELLA
jgi:hypothetical protein